MLPTRTAGILGVMAACAVACSHPVEDFVQSGSVEAGSADALLTDSSWDGRTDSNVADAGPPAPTGTCSSGGGPGGAVCMPGSNSVDLGAKNEAVCGAGGCSAEQPEVTVRLSSYWIDEHEVTVGRFRRWWNSSPRSWPDSSDTYFRTSSRDFKWRSSWPSEANEPAKGAECTWLGGGAAGNDDKPINCVDWYTALAFCLSEGKRLPTEAEWEYAASAGQDRLFPWSAAATENDSIPAGEPTCGQALFGTCTPLTASSGSTIWGRTRQGVWNMSGSLAEWVLDGYTSTWTFSNGTNDPFADPAGTSSTPLRLARGGSFKSSSAKELRAAARPTAGSSATAQDLTIGFRCAKRN